MIWVGEHKEGHREKILNRLVSNLTKWTDLHADALQGVVVALPAVPDHSNGIQSGIGPPAINPIGVGSMTVGVPEAPQEFSGTVAIPDILVLIQGAEPLATV